MASILDRLDSLGDEHPHKLLYSYIDLNGNPLERYTYASFLRRTKAIAEHLRKQHRFATEDRLLLALGSAGGRAVVPGQHPLGQSGGARTVHLLRAVGGRAAQLLVGERAPDGE